MPPRLRDRSGGVPPQSLRTIREGFFAAWIGRELGVLAAAGGVIAGIFGPGGKSRKFVTASHDNYLQISSHFMVEVEIRWVGFIRAMP